MSLWRQGSSTFHSLASFLWAVLWQGQLSLQISALKETWLSQVFLAAVACGDNPLFVVSSIQHGCSLSGQPDAGLLTPLARMV